MCGNGLQHSHSPLTNDWHFALTKLSTRIYCRYSWKRDATLHHLSRLQFAFASSRPIGFWHTWKSSHSHFWHTCMRSYSHGIHAGIDGKGKSIAMHNLYSSYSRRALWLWCFQAHLVADIRGCQCTVYLAGGCKVYILVFLPEERQRRFQLQRICSFSGGHDLQRKPIQVYRHFWAGMIGSVFASDLANRWEVALSLCRWRRDLANYRAGFSWWGAWAQLTWGQ